MRILIATPLYPPDDGGPATRASVLEKELPAHDVEVQVVSFSKFRHLPKGISHARFFFALFSAAKNVDVIYALDPVSVGLPSLAVSFLRGTPLALSIVGDYAWEQGVQRFGVKENLDEFVKRKNYPITVKSLRFIESFVARNAQLVIAPSKYLKKIITLWGVSAEKIVVVYNSFDDRPLTTSKEELRKEFNMTTPTIISVGRFVPWKGFKVLMDAVSLLKKDIPDVSLLIAGSGIDLEYVGYAKERGYDFVKFLGLVDHSVLMKQIRAADCFALNTGYEGLSHLLLETMALETPIVTTNVGGNVELLDEDRGYLVSHDDKDALANALRMVFFDKEKMQKNTKNAKEFVAQFTQERMVTATLLLLGGVIKKI